MRRTVWASARRLQCIPVRCCSVPVIAKHLAKEEYQQALDAHERMRGQQNGARELTVVEYNALIRAANQLQNSVKATSLLQEMTEGQIVPNAKTISLLMQGYGRAQQHDQVIALYESLADLPLQPDRIIQSLALTSYTALDRPEADSLREQLQTEGALDAYDHGALVRGSIAKGQYDAAIKTMNMMIQEGQQPTVALWTKLIRAMCYDKELDRALDLLHTMNQSGTPPDSTIFQVLLNGACKNQVSRVPDVLGTMSQYHFTPPSKLFASLIMEFTKKRDYDTLKQIYLKMKEMKGVEIDGRAYSNFIQAASRSRDHSRALQIYREAGQAGAQLHPFAFPLLVDSCMRLGDLVAMREILQEAPMHNFHPTIELYNKALTVAKTKGQLDEGFTLLQSIHDRGLTPTIVTYTCLITLCLAKREKGEVAHLLQEMSEQGLLPDGPLRHLLRKNRIAIPTNSTS